MASSRASSAARTRPKVSAAPWWKGAVVYHIYVRSFFDSDGDGHGDLKGVAAKLDYIADLGVDAIWLSPVHPSPNRDWGYDVSDFEGVHPDYGSMADLEALVDAAHGRRPPGPPGRPSIRSRDARPRSRRRHSPSRGWVRGGRGTARWRRPRGLRCSPAWPRRPSGRRGRRRRSRRSSAHRCGRRPRPSTRARPTP